MYFCCLAAELLLLFLCIVAYFSNHFFVSRPGTTRVVHTFVYKNYFNLFNMSCWLINFSGVFKFSLAALDSDNSLAGTPVIKYDSSSIIALASCRRILECYYFMVKHDPAQHSPQSPTPLVVDYATVARSVVEHNSKFQRR